MTQTQIPTEPNKSSNKRSFYIILIVLLIVANVVLIFMHLNSSKKNTELEARRKEADSTLAVVNSELQSKIQEYQQLMGENATLDSTLKSNIEELQKKQGRIDELIKQKNVSASELKKAQEEIANLRAETTQFASRIDSLSGALKYMTQVNDSLSTTLKGKIAEGEQLQNEKQELSKKVALGALLKPYNVKVVGVTYKGKKAKETETDKGKKAEKLKISFDIPDNQVADAGPKTILICIQDPSQSTISVESGGSGTFKVNGEPKQYTTSAPFDYDNTKKSIVVYWSQSNAYAAGNYKVQFYDANGTFLSDGSFTLK